MFDKKSLELLPGCKPYIAGIVLSRWIALLSNIAMMMLLGSWLSYQLILPGVVMPSTTWFILLAVLIILRASMLYVSQRISDRLAHKAKTSVRQQVYDKLLKLGPSFEESVRASEAMQLSVEGASQLEVYYAGYLPQFMYAVLAPLTLFISLVHFAGIVAAVLLLIVPFIPVSIVLVQKKARVAGRKYWSNYVDLGGSFLEAVQGLTTLKIYEVDQAWHDRLNKESETFRQTTMRMLRLQLRSIVVMDLFAYFGAACGIVLALVLFSIGHITFFAAFLVVFLSQEFFLPMRTLGSLFHAGMGGMAASKKMIQILEAPVPSRGDVEIDKINKSADIKLKNVSYAYGERKVVSDVSFEASQGSFTGIVGHSGSGKSTISRVIAGAKSDFEGEITLRDISYRDITASSLMRSITYVGADAHLFSGSIGDNLRMAKPDATDAELWHVLDQVRIANFVRAAGGLDFRISEGAVNVSGGQAQRLSLARALLHDSPVYLFDEITSNIDGASEKAISEVIEKLAETHTVIMVAHRLHLVKNAKTIIVMDEGKVSEQGTHEELLLNKSGYFDMWTAQENLAALGATKGYTLAEEDDALLENTPDQSSATSEHEISHRSGAAVIGQLIKLISPLAPYVLLAILLGSIGHLFALAIPSLGALGIVNVMSENDLLKANTVSFGLICALILLSGVSRGFARYAEQLCNHYIAFRILAHIRDLVFAVLRKLAPAKLEGRGKGDVVSLATADIELLEVFYAHTISPVAIALIVSSIVVGVFAHFSGRLALLAALGYVVIGVIVPVVTSKALAGTGACVRAQNGAINAFVLDRLRGISETIQYAQEKEASKELSNQTNQIGTTEDKLKRANALTESIAATAIMLFALWILESSLTLAWSGGISMAAAFVLTFTYFSSFGPVIAVCRLGANLQQTIGSGERVLDLLDEEPEVEDITDGEDFEFDGAQVSHVTFSYGKDGEKLNILEDVSVSFPAGSITCINGKSGSGKSTLLKLLMRFWDKDSGAITFAGKDISEINTKSLRASEAYMTQSTYLFDTTIRENIKIANPDATEEEIMRAISSAALDDFIAHLPKGLDSKVGDLGSSLSGGEKQRIGLARVFLHNAPFILLDEPTSNLDALSEAQVMNAIVEGGEGKTIALVTHRASTAAFADQTVVIENGRIKDKVATK